jgi:hypothetical protein
MNVNKEVIRNVLGSIEDVYNVRKNSRASSSA